MTEYVKQLARFAHSVQITDAIRQDVTERILDTIGNSLAGRTESLKNGSHEPDLAVERAVRSWGGVGQSLVIGGNGGPLPAASAALINGTLAHVLDFDDTHLPSVLHPSASIIPAALAVAQEVDATPDQLIHAIAVGIEICNRLGMASYIPEIRNSLFFEKGFHATSICGTIGAAAASAYLYGLDADRIADAMGIAVSMGAGVIEANRTGGTVKRIHCGWAAHGGITAAAFAREGVTGPPTVLEGRFGFFNAYLDGKYDEHALIDDLGIRWELLRTVYKPYPTNHFTHPGIDCALALRSQIADLTAISRIDLGVAMPVMRTIAEPREEKTHPKSGYHAKFSGPYTIAAALAGGGGLGLYLDDFGSGWDAPSRLGLASLVEVHADEIATGIFPRAFAAHLKITMNDGSVLEHRVDASRGSELAPLTREDVLTKFRLNASRSLPESAVQELLANCGLKDREQLSRFLKVLA
ncbi:MAG: MmgE/PrpD family protein [Actinobacteria bacterium]|nr:MAG: MmgE/PrpD family protein [Actinomycetota bacterium]